MSESQEDTIEEFLNYQVADPLSYSEFSYDKSEWDNIPTIIPRFTLFLSKHLQALTGKCHERFTQISTPELEAKIEGKLKDLEEKFELKAEKNQAQCDEISTKLGELLQKTQDLETDLEKQREREAKECSVKMGEIIPTPTADDFLKQFEKDEQLANQEGNLPTEESENELGVILREKEWYKQSNEK